MSTSIVHLSTPLRGSRLRITARGRVVLAVIVAAPLVALALWFGLNSGVAGAAGQSQSSTPAVEHVTVTQGESLWQLAEKIAPHDDPRDVISAIVDFNDLQSSVVMPGQSLAIPPQFSH
ncbi:LysM peptidoglycan-binding domain-containing protein [Gryllotalpicola reticulitermitis]|uniref:LysM peptidoglycan-binding domain-containing protein n=1 Tax=Gryllotalpicola reticulitermitis TaxID=1184153 RepID=A0ABV8Q6S0_9MICO